MTALYVLCGIALLLIYLFSRKLHISAGFYKQPFFSLRFLFFRFSSEKLPSPKDKGKKQKASEKKPEKKKKEKEKPKTKLDIKELLSLILYIIKKLIRWFGSALYIEKADIRICIATDDAAKTAVLYGAVSPLVGEITQLCLKMRHRKKHDALIRTRCEADFIGERTDAVAEVTLAFRLWRIFPLAVTAVKAYFKFKKIQKPVE